MEERRREMLRFLVTIALLLGLSPAVSSLSDEGRALMALKASFSNVANVLLDWNPVAAGGDVNRSGDDHCAWRGVVCDSLTSAVVSL